MVDPQKVAELAERAFWEVVRGMVPPADPKNASMPLRQATKFHSQCEDVVKLYLQTNEVELADGGQMSYEDTFSQVMRGT